MNNGRKPPSLHDILRGDDDFEKAWSEAPSVPTDRDPIPPGQYRCLVSGGRLAESRQKATPCFKVEFEVIEGERTGRKVFLDLWLSPAALRISKPQLVALGIATTADLHKPCPALGAIAEVDVALRTDDEGKQWNEVRGFRVVESAPVDDFAPGDAPEPQSRRGFEV